MPSTVVTDLPAAARAGIRQLTTGAPSTSTVQAPQTPAPQTSLVPVRLRSPRTTSIRSASGSSGKVAERPLIVIVLICDLQVFCQKRVFWGWRVFCGKIFSLVSVLRYVASAMPRWRRRSAFAA